MSYLQQCKPFFKDMLEVSERLMLWLNFILGLNFISLCFNSLSYQNHTLPYPKAKGNKIKAEDKIQPQHKHLNSSILLKTLPCKTETVQNTFLIKTISNILNQQLSESKKKKFHDYSHSSRLILLLLHKSTSVSLFYSTTQ